MIEFVKGVEAKRLVPPLGDDFVILARTLKGLPYLSNEYN